MKTEIWNCATTWEAQSNELLLLRVFSTRHGANVIRLSSPASRKPKNMPERVQQEMDDWFEHHFGIRFRQRAIFSTGCLDVASDYAGDYGEVRALRPAAEFCFCWSRTCIDLYGAWAAHPRAHPGDPVATLLDSLDFTCEDLGSALRSGHEIMLVCSSIEATIFNH